MNSILITGADGLLGSHLIDFCVNRKFKIYGLKKPDAPIKNLAHYLKESKSLETLQKTQAFGFNIKIPSNNNKLDILECDIKNAVLMEKLILNVKPKYIFHFAAQPYVIPSWKDPVDTIRTNVIGTINVFEPLKKKNFATRVIVACSSAEYGTTTEFKRPLRETDPLLAVHPYGISKIATELLASQYFTNSGIDIIILRFFNQTGPRKVNDACSDFIRSIAKIELGIIEPKIYVGNLNPYRDITGIKDSIRAIWLAATKGKNGETYNVCSSKKIQIREILNLALNFSSKKIKIKENTPEKLRTTDEDIILGDNSKIKALGFEITQPIEETLKDMFNYWIDFYKKKYELN